VNKKIAVLAVLCTILILMGGIQTTILYSTQYLSSKPSYSFSISSGLDWWDCNWSYCKKITIDHTKVQATQTDYPVLLYENKDDDLKAYAQPDGDDIAFVDQYNTTQYKHEIEKYVSSTGELVAWVKIPSVSHLEDTILYMYYGNPSCGNQENVTATWNSNYKMIQHLNESAGVIFDSTANSNDGTNNGAAYNASSKIDGGHDFDGSDNIDCGTSSSLNITSQITLEGWAKDPPLFLSSLKQTTVRAFDKREINITKAEHLDEKRDFLKDIYEYVKVKDNNWSEPVNNREYVRVTFSEALDKTSDIAIFARSYGVAEIKVYPKDKDTPITTFDHIVGGNWYKVYLTNLTNKYSTFDLRTIGDPVEFDYIVDPPPQTKIDTISPYKRSSSPLTVTATNTTPTDKVTLWYRYSSDNSTWWNSSCTYRQKITITGQAGAGPNYQVLLKIGETSGVSGANFSLYGHSLKFPSGKNVGGDLRFINKSDTTSLDFWVEDVSGTAPNRLAKVWVEVKDSLNSSTDIYCYYGNPSASNASNGTNTFNFFDNFDDNSIDASKWTTYQGTWSETGGIMRQTSTGTADPKKCIATSAPQSNYYAIRAKVRPDSGTSADARAGLSIKTSTTNGQGYNYVFHDFVTKTTEQFLDDAVAWGTSYARSAWSFGTWYWFEIYHDGTNVKGRVWNIGGTPGAFNSWTRSGRSGYLALNGGSMGETASFDDVFVRRCIATEPVFSSVVNEEKWMKWNSVNNPDTKSPWSWTFNFPNGTGYYEFYSIGNKTGEVNETAPYTADAKCYCGEIPIASNPIPADGATLIPVPPGSFNITISDQKGHKMNITWRTNSSGIWKTFNTTVMKGNGTYGTTNTSWVTSYSKKYWWCVNVTDGRNWTNATYSFTTKAPDSIKPSSNVTAIIPYWKGPKNNPLTIICTDAKDDPGGTGLKNVTLYYYNSTNNATWKGPWMFGVDTDPWVACSWSFTFPNGTGYYRFYSRAADNNSNIEDPPVTNDTKCGYDAVKPTSKVDTIFPYIFYRSPHTFTATASDSLTSVKNTTLWYRYSSDNSSWSSWLYKKKITITGQAGAGTNYQVPLKIGETSGASGADFNLGGHSSNFPSGKNVGGDLRFFGKDNTTSLDFWVESVSGTTPNRLAKVWVEVKDSLNSSTDIYCYYGNPSASNASNGTKTFLVFDDFNGASLNTNIWTTYQVDSTSFSNSIMTTTVNNKDPAKVIANVGGSGPTDNNLAIRTYFRATGGSSSDQRMGVGIKTGTGDGRGYNYVLHNFLNMNAIQWLDDYVAWGPTPETSWAKNTWYTFEISHDGTNIRARRDDGTWQTWTRSGRTGYFALNTGGFSESGVTGDWEYALIRKCIATEPAFSSADSEKGLSRNWIRWNNASNPDISSPWSWNFNFPNNTGYYQFYSIANDTVGNQEDAPSSADASCHYINDTTKPTSFVNATAPPYWKKTSPLMINVTASDAGGSGLKNVTLYYYNSTNNVTFKGPWKFGSTNTTPWKNPTAIPWSFTFPNNTGYYRFYSVAYDNATNKETFTGNDTKCGYDVALPISNVNAITPYWKKSSPLAITVTASDTGSGLKNVTLYYYNSTNNNTWKGPWKFGNTNTTPWVSPIRWNFNFPNGTGYYKFYSVAYDNATNKETFTGNDTLCGYDNQPPISWVNAIAAPYWKKSTLMLTITASDNGPSGLKNVTLYYYNSTNNVTFKGPWKFRNTNTTPWVSPIRWNFNFPNGTGYYKFYSVAYDNATNKETFTGNDTLCGYDNQPPISWVNAITPYWKKTSPLTITVTANDVGNGLKNVTLYYYNSTNNVTFKGPWKFHNTNTTPWITPTWYFNFPNGTGYYRFYSVAYDNATNKETFTGNDTKCGYDNVAPTSSVNAISPYTQISSPLITMATTADNGPSGLKNVSLYYRFSNDNSSWGGWTNYGVNTTPWKNGGHPKWNFAFSSTGYYEFYSIATDNATNNESAPGTADARCFYNPNTPPILSNENPANGSTGISLNPTLGIQVSDKEGNRMNITWYWGITSSCPNYIGKSTSVNNGTYYRSNDNNFSSNSQTYYWRVVVNDGWGGWTNATYHFTTIGANKTIISKGRSAYSLEISPSGTTLYGYVNGNSVQTSIDTSWHYVTLTYDGSQLKIYEDGKFKANTSMTGSINTNANSVLLGRYLTGTLDEIRVSSIARSAAWINTTYRDTNSPTTFATFGNQIGILSTWLYRKSITISASMTSSDLTNFPVLISTTDSDLKNNALTNGYDILFTNKSVDWTSGSTTQKLDHEIEKYDSSTGKLVAWVRIPLLSSTSNTVIYMYYGNHLCTANRQNPTGVWDSNYIGVWHLNDAPSDGGTHHDSTSRNHALTFHDSNSNSNTNAVGIANGADDLNGDADYMDGSHHSDFDLNSFTLECWVTLDDKSDYHSMINKEITDYSNRNFGLYSNTVMGVPIVQFRNSGGTNETVTGTTDLTSAGWHYVVGRNNGSYLALYVNGTSQGTPDAVASNPKTQNAALMIGRENSTVTPRYWNGKIDEIRISNNARSAAWIGATYKTISAPGTYLTFGPQKTRNVAPTQSNPSPSNGATGQSLNPQLAITVNDTNADKMNVTFRTNASGTWTTIGSNNSKPNGTYRQTTTNMNNYGTKYWWSVNVTDGTTWTNATYSFTTYYLLTIRPNAAGRSTHLTRGPPGGAPAANYMCVDEVTQNGDTDYVYSTNQATYVNDTYNLTNHATETGNINYVKIYLCGRYNKSGAGGVANAMKPVIYTNSKYYDVDAAIALTNSYVTSSWTHTTNPVTSSTWTWSEIDNLEVGVALIGNQYQYSNCTQVYAEVIYIQ
jgi:hypothetical protein